MPFETGHLSVHRMSDLKDFDDEKRAFDARLEAEKRRFDRKLSSPVASRVVVPAVAEFNHAQIVKTGFDVLQQPHELAPEAMVGYHPIGTFQIGTSVQAAETLARHSLDTPLPVWSYDEYLYALRSVEGWKRTLHTHQDAVARWEHSEVEAQGRYEHQKQRAYDQHEEQLLRSYDSDKPFYGSVNEPYKPTEKPEPRLALDADQILFGRQFERVKHTPNIDGYLAYIRDQSESLFSDLLREYPAYVHEKHRVMHTYIVGGSGSGKSELMKSIIHSYATGDQSSVVVLDPNGDFAGQIARWHEFINNPRLVYLEYNLELGHSFTINPFEVSGLDPTDRSKEAIATRIVVADQLQDAFVQIVAGGSGGDEFSTNMKALLMPCITALLEKPGATILDLQRFMNDEDNDDLLAFAKSLTHYKNNVVFFETEFLDKSYSPTKKAVAKKIRSLLNFPAFGHLTCGKSTVDLEALANDKKVIIFNIAKGRIGNSVTGAFGRLVVSMLQGMALRREEIARADRVPCHLFLDECHNFISPSIEEVMTEARKYGLHLTMAQQAIGYKMSYALKELVKINSQIKISGKMPKSAWKATADYIGVDDPSDFSRLKQGKYIMAVDPTPPLMFAGRTDLLDDRNCVSDKLWRLTKSQQMRFYRGVSGEEITASNLSENTQEEVEEITEIRRRNVAGFDVG